ncbi:Mpv17 / PMP22 family protein [Paramecium bursaria Chlorella virus CVR-1]|uniref:Mpv17 / PMP22 family protein n=1 Tax=Paramecium bursaria Chlorella virus CVA-1 TaxID=42683 RepID=M1HF31_9PHYC|nr:Mpv17 / PMP22 family protein [Paramecium bursaria Chlorella virus CVA-1]AGE50427.1 Mpv17 / PMP22 family protein [Paramecium bursaria Chlorella virus CVA-1]AGE52105.1 Mpv17 / PMP22 family protein [Paramecium bursaria Chlorella virus CVR-1]
MNIPWKVHQNAMLAGGIACGVDVTLQWMKSKRVDFKQTARIVSFSALSTYPQASYFNAIDRIFHKKTLQSVINKTLTNQIVFAPINLSCAIAWNLAFQQKTHLISNKIKTSMVPSMVEGSSYWIPINILAFSMVPASHRIVFFKLAGIPYKVMFNMRVNKK